MPLIIFLASSPVTGRGAGATDPCVFGATSLPSCAIYLPLLGGSGIGILQLSTEAAVEAKAGRIVTTDEAATAPSISTPRRPADASWLFPPFSADFSGVSQSSAIRTPKCVILPYIDV